MARPTPIIVPGPSGMGGKERSSMTTVDLSWIPKAMELWKEYVTKPKQELEGASALASMVNSSGLLNETMDEKSALSFMRSVMGENLETAAKNFSAKQAEKKAKATDISNMLSGIEQQTVPDGSDENATKKAYTPDIMSKLRILTNIGGALGGDVTQEIGNLLGLGKKSAEPDRYESLGNGIFWDKQEGKQVEKPETVTPKADMMDIEIDGKNVSVPASVVLSHLDRKAQREQTNLYREDMLELRKQMHEENLAIREENRKIANTYKDDAVMTVIVGKFNSDTTVKQTEKMDEFANLIVDVANSENPIGHASLATLMARASGEVGNLSEMDKKPFGGTQALVGKTEQFFKQLYDGKKTPENLKFVSDLAKTFKASAKLKKTEIAYERANQYSQANKKQGKSPQEIFNILSPFDNYDVISKGKEQNSLRDKYGY